MAYLDDIEAQPEVIARLTARLEASEAVRQAASRIAASRGVWLAGMGSSYAAAMYGRYMLAGPGRWVYTLDAGEALHYMAPSCRAGDVGVLISQSGASYETTRLAEALRGHTFLIAITNRADSPLATLADAVITLDVPPDEAVSVKTYTATLTALAVLGVRAGGIEPASPALLREALAAAIHEGRANARTLARALAQRYVSVVGRGPALASALFGALLLKEAAGRPAEALSGGQFRHGPMELAGPGHAAVVLAPAGATAELQRRLARDLATYGSSVLLVGPPPEPGPSEGVSFWPIPELAEPWSPLVQACALQWLAWACGVEGGRQVGRLLRTPRVVDYE